MNLINRLESWGDAHHPKWLDVIRIVLGIFLMLKGFEFVNNMDHLSALISSSGFLGVMSATIIAHYVVFAHIVGGILIACGLLTRMACIIQVPILIGALILINSTGSALQPYTERWMSLLLLVILGFFIVEGSGPISVDAYMKKHPEEKHGQLK
jgi:putative oxidoreductase